MSEPETSLLVCYFIPEGKLPSGIWSKIKAKLNTKSSYFFVEDFELDSVLGKGILIEKDLCQRFFKKCKIDFSTKRSGYERIELIHELTSPVVITDKLIPAVSISPDPNVGKAMEERLGKLFYEKLYPLVGCHISVNLSGDEREHDCPENPKNFQILLGRVPTRLPVERVSTVVIFSHNLFPEISDADEIGNHEFEIAGYSGTGIPIFSNVVDNGKHVMAETPLPDSLIVGELSDCGKQLCLYPNIFITRPLHGGSIPDDYKYNFFERVVDNVVYALTHFEDENNRKLFSSRQKYIERCGTRIKDSLEATKTQFEAIQLDIALSRTEFMRLIQVEQELQCKISGLLSREIDNSENFGIEYDALVRNRLIEKITLLDDGMVFHTVPIISENPNTGHKHVIGKFMVSMTTNGTVRFINKTYRGKKNPGGEYQGCHIFYDGRPCYGNFSGVIPEYIAQGEWAVAANMALSFLHSCNPQDSAGAIISKYPKYVPKEPKSESPKRTSSVGVTIPVAEERETVGVQ